MTSNVNFDVRPILQLCVIALCVVSQPLNRKITQNGSACKFTSRSLFTFANDRYVALQLDAQMRELCSKCLVS